MEKKLLIDHTWRHVSHFQEKRLVCNLFKK